MEGSHSILPAATYLQTLPPRRAWEAKIHPLPSVTCLATRDEKDSARLMRGTEIRVVDAIVLDAHHLPFRISDDRLHHIASGNFLTSIYENELFNSSLPRSTFSSPYIDRKYVLPDPFRISNSEAFLETRPQPQEEEGVSLAKSFPQIQADGHNAQEREGESQGKSISPLKRKAAELQQQQPQQQQQIQNDRPQKARRTIANNINNRISLSEEEIKPQRLSSPLIPNHISPPVEEIKSQRLSSPVATEVNVEKVTTEEETPFISLETPQSISTQIRKLEEEQKGRQPMKRRHCTYEKKVKFEATNRKGGLLDTPEPSGPPGHSWSIWNLHTGRSSYSGGTVDAQYGANRNGHNHAGHTC